MADVQDAKVTATEALKADASPSSSSKPADKPAAAAAPAAAPKAPSSSKSSSSSSAALVPVNPENIEFGAGVVGGVAGLLVGGPVLALLLSVAANYGSKQKNDVGDAVRGLSKTAIDAFNFLSSLNAKYAVTEKAGSAVTGYVGKLKEYDDSKSLEKVEESLKAATGSAKKLADEYDLVAKGKQALGVVGELADTAIIKTVELEKEYKVVDTLGSKVKEVVKTAAVSDPSKK